MKQDKGRVTVQVEIQRVRQEWWWEDKEGNIVRAKRERENRRQRRDNRGDEVGGNETGET